MARRSAVILCTFFLGLTAAACSSPHPSTTAPPATTTIPSTPPPTATTTTAVGGSTRCQIGQLVASEVGMGGAAGTIELTFSLHNTSSTLCTLTGFPSVAMFNSSGTAITTTVIQGGDSTFSPSFTNSISPTTVSVTPGGEAEFNLGYSDVPTGSETTCLTATSLRVTPPGVTTGSIPVTVTLMPCDQGTVAVSPVFAEDGASAQTAAPPTG